MADTYSGRSDISSQGESSVPITPGDTSSADLVNVPKALWVDVGGTLKFTAGGLIDTWTVAAGPVPLRPTRVWATGTSATGIHGVY